MCDITKKYKPGYHAQVGYKAAIKKPDGKYYSASTGIEYKLGKVQVPETFELLNRYWSPCGHGEIWYAEDHKGLTSIFINKDDALATARAMAVKEYIFFNTEVVLLQMKIGGIKYKGSVGASLEIDADVFMGTIIRSIVEIPMFEEEWAVLSPDGIPIFFDKTYSSLAKAKAAFNIWKKRFVKQGYYSFNLTRIPLVDLESFCTLEKLK